MKISLVKATRNFLTMPAHRLRPGTLASARPEMGRPFARLSQRIGVVLALSAIAAMPLAASGATPYATGAPPAENRAVREKSAAKPNPDANFNEDAAEVVFEHLTENNGLANPVVTAFAEDGDGFLWVASQSGVQRWDGYRFWAYKTKLGDPQSLPDNLVNTLYTDTQGRLWAGTSSGGLARYDRSNDRFIRYQTSNAGRVNIISITGDGGKGLWIVADDGLHHLDPDSGAFARADLASVDGRSPQATVVLRSADGAIWAGTNLGLEWSAPDGGNGVANRKFERFLLPVPKGAPTQITSLFCDRTGRVWVGTQNGAFVLESSNEASNRGRTRIARPVESKGPIGGLLATKRILSIAETSQGEIWFGTQDMGILAVNPENGATRQIDHNPALPDSLSSDWVTALYLGRGSMMWVGTQRNISYVTTTPKTALTLFGGAGTDQPFTDTDVYSILPRRDGSIWLGLKNNGINILDAEGHKTGDIRPRPDISSREVPLHGLPTGTVPCMAGADDGSVYICTQRALYRTDALAGGGKRSAPPQITRVPTGDEAVVELASLLPDKVPDETAGGTAEKNVLWIAGRNGLFEIDRDDKVGPARRPHLSQPLTDPRLTVLLRGNGYSLWIGTENGLNRLNVKTGAVETIPPDPGDPAALGAGLISSLLIDKAGRLWVGTFSGGINVLEGRDANGRPRFHRILEGLPNENVDTLLSAPDGSIWASTDGGLARIDPATYNITVSRRAEGSILEAYWNNVGAVTKSGELLFGGTGGMTVVRPKLDKPWTYEPPVVVTHANIGLASPSLSRFNSGENEPPVWLAPDHDDLTVEFTALDYSAPELNHYEYKLEGFDKDWVAADPTRRVARYTNLPPGNYTLLLRGSNRDGMWASPRKIKVHVIPAWYQTWWFDVLAVLVSLLVLFGLFLLGTAYLRRQQRELERQVALRTSELHRMTVELQDSQLMLQHIAYSDSLTNLPNRRMFTEHFRQLLAMKMRQGGGFTLLLIDFDRFKQINDTFGHDAGDAVLKEMAHRMAATVRAADCFARLGGDEFGLLLAEAPDADGLDTVCQKILMCFEDPIEFNGVELRTSPSVGVAMFPEDGETQDRLYKAADVALYQTKRQGGNGTSWQGMELKGL